MGRLEPLGRCKADMRPTVDETIRFYREDGAYVLVHDGTLDGGSKLRYVIRLIEREMQLKLKSLGYFGQGTHTQNASVAASRLMSTLSPGERVNCSVCHLRRWPPA